MAVGSLFSCQLWICCVPEFLGDFLFQTVWEGSHNQINLADRNHNLINLFSEDACIDPCASLEGRSFWHGQPGFKCCVPLLCFHVTRINGCFFFHVQRFNGRPCRSCGKRTRRCEKLYLGMLSLSERRRTRWGKPKTPKPSLLSFGSGFTNMNHKEQLKKRRVV